MFWRLLRVTQAYVGKNHHLGKQCLQFGNSSLRVVILVQLILGLLHDPLLISVQAARAAGTGPSWTNDRGGPEDQEESCVCGKKAQPRCNPPELLHSHVCNFVNTYSKIMREKFSYACYALDNPLINYIVYNKCPF